MVGGQLGKQYMKKFIFFFFTLFLLSFAGYSQNTLLWKISGNGLDKPSYLYGTIHLQDKRAFRFRDSVLICIKQADIFVSEVLIKELKDPKILQQMVAPEGEQLDDILSKNEYDKLSEKFKAATGNDIGLFKSLRPFAIMQIMLTGHFVNDAPYTVDEYLSRTAESFNKPLLALESLDFQMELLLSSFGKKELFESLGKSQGLSRP